MGELGLGTLIVRLSDGKGSDSFLNGAEGLPITNVIDKMSPMMSGEGWQSRKSPWPVLKSLVIQH
jgi:hypothetical protein